MSTTTGPTPEYLRDYGNTVDRRGPRPTTSTLYKAASGALVFSAGSVQWTWGLDAEHDSPFPPEPADVRMQQAQVNLLADMSAQPTTLMAGLVAASRSTDTTGPTVTITSPTGGASIAQRRRSAPSPARRRTRRRRRAGVEVSTNGGDTWHPATGTTSWTYPYVQTGMGTTDLRVRAIRRLGQHRAPSHPQRHRRLPVLHLRRRGAADPREARRGRGRLELGLRFSPPQNGFLTGVRFYKGAGNGGTHQGSLWSAAGPQLGRGTFTGETATGWQSMRVHLRVPVTAGRPTSRPTPHRRAATPSAKYAFYGNPNRAAAPGGRRLRGAGGGCVRRPGAFPSRQLRQLQLLRRRAVVGEDDSPLTATQLRPWPARPASRRSSVGPGELRSRASPTAL